MATSSTSAFPKKRNRFKLSFISLFLAFLFCLFLFSRRVLDPKLFLYRDLVYQSPASLLLSPPRSTEFHVDFDVLRQPVSEVSNHVDENVDANITVSSELSEAEVKEIVGVSSESDLDDKTTQDTTMPADSSEPESDDNSGEITGEPVPVIEKTTVPISSNSDLDDKTGGKPIEEKSFEDTASLNSTETESEENSGEITNEPMSSNEKTTVPISSKSDLDDETRGKPESLGVKEKSFENAASLDTETKPEENSGEITDENEKTTVPISSESDLDDKTRGKPELLGVKDKSFENAASSDTETEGIVVNAMLEKLRNCDIYKGKWVRDEGYPLYRPGSCPYVDDGFDCHGNGRPDSEYLKWRWQPDGCVLPRFNATDFLVRLRGKRLLLVGDSMNRNQFESLLCLLREALPDKNKMYEVHGYKITKGRGYYIFKVEGYNCSVEFVRSHFLVREGIRINAQGNSNPTLSIDRIDKTARRWQRADILVFNTGHWWTHGKTSKGKNYYKEGNFIYPRFDAVEAYRRAIRTWATWIKKNIRKDKLVFYRGYSSAHFRGGDWDSGGSCKGETDLVISGAIMDSYPQKMTIVEEVLRETRVPVLLLNVTHLTNYRKDGHPSIYGKNMTALKKVSRRRQDCSHWCLPGVPDAWNELIYTTLVARQGQALFN